MTFCNLPDYLTVRQTADELHCHPDTVAALIRRGELRSVRLGRAVRVISESLKALASHTPGENAFDNGADMASDSRECAASHPIRAIRDEMDREGRLAFLNKRHAEYHEAEVLRHQAATQFAVRNGWRPMAKLFCPYELGRKGTCYGPFGAGVEFFDHTIAFTAGGRNVALVGQPYACSANVDAFRTFAAQMKLAAHVPPNPRASFWNPGATLFLVLTLPGVDVQWLPEQEERV